MNVISIDCVCSPFGTSCSEGFNSSCGNCDFLNLPSGTFGLTKECINENGGITPILRIDETSVDLWLEKGIFQNSGGFEMTGSVAIINFIGDYRVDLFRSLKTYAHENVILFGNEVFFNYNTWEIYGPERYQYFITEFSTQATFNNFRLVAGFNSMSLFKQNVKFENCSILYLKDCERFRVNELFECENSEVNFYGSKSLNLNQVVIKSNSKWNIMGDFSNSYCQNTIKVSNSNVTFEDNSNMNCCFNTEDYNSYFFIGNRVTCFLSLYDSKNTNIFIRNENRITVEVLFIHSNFSKTIINQIIPKRLILSNDISITFDSSGIVTECQIVELNDNSELKINKTEISIQELRCNRNGILKVINGATLIMNSFNFHDSCQLIVEDSTLRLNRINFYDNSSLTIINSKFNFTLETASGINLFNESSAIIEKTLYPFNTATNPIYFLFSTYDESKLIFKNGYQSNAVLKTGLGAWNCEGFQKRSDGDWLNLKLFVTKITNQNQLIFVFFLKQFLEA